jgi:cysteinyl-tRNA synthetase
MALVFFNTLSKRKEEFKPLKGKTVRMYTCGPTVYDFAHIGNFRAYVFEDVLRRYLEYKKYGVKQVMNLTDVDDKTIKGAKKAGVSLQEYTKKYSDAFFEDIKKLNIEKAEVYPRATEHVKEMVSLIQLLLKKGFAYRSGDGSIYYNVRKFTDYGKLSGITVGELREGARVSQDSYEKEQAADFALWKKWDAEDGDVFWETPLGKGRPGWHIECSAMSVKYLGESFDIHTGGVDNMFPHHENEIAQSEAATGKQFVRYWLHCEHLLVNGRKMSKSLGNFYTLRDVLAKGFSPAAVRWFLLSGYYRQQLNFTFGALESAEKTVHGILDFVERLKEKKKEERKKVKQNPEVKKLIGNARKGFEKGMDDDLNTPVALAALFEFERKANKLLAEEKISSGDAKEMLLLLLQELNKVLGILEYAAGKKIGGAEKKGIEKLVAEREAARRKGDYAAADRIRKELGEKGIILEDAKGGTRWRIA